MMFKKIRCKITGHNLIKGGSCPFTGKTYEYCTRCNDMVEKGKIGDQATWSNASSKTAG
jgi:hypothetical protein